MDGDFQMTKQGQPFQCKGHNFKKIPELNLGLYFITISQQTSPARTSFLAHLAKGHVSLWHVAACVRACVRSSVDTYFRHLL